MRGYDVYFLTGADEHGQKIERKAAEAGVTPQQYVDNIVAGFHSLWQLMDISNDGFVRTTDDYHVACVQKVFKKLYDQGDIYKSSQPDSVSWFLFSFKQNVFRTAFRPKEVCADSVIQFVFNSYSIHIGNSETSSETPVPKQRRPGADLLRAAF